jgi:hypothetical protein
MLAPLWLDPERGSWEEVVRAVEEAGRQKWAELAEQRCDWGLPMALYVACRCTGLSFRGLGEAAVHLDYSAVWMCVQRFDQRLAKEKSLAKLAQRLMNELKT